MRTIQVVIMNIENGVPSSNQDVTPLFQTTAVIRSCEVCSARGRPNLPEPCRTGPVDTRIAVLRGSVT